MLISTTLLDVNTLKTPFSSLCPVLRTLNHFLGSSYGLRWTIMAWEWRHYFNKEKGLICLSEWESLFPGAFWKYTEPLCSSAENVIVVWLFRVPFLPLWGKQLFFGGGDSFCFLCCYLLSLRVQPSGGFAPSEMVPWWPSVAWAVNISFP